MLCFDGHLDLGWNALTWNRDLKSSIEDIRQKERESGNHLQGSAYNTVSLPEMRKANIFLSFPTILTWTNTVNDPTRGYWSQEQTYCAGMSQLHYYRILEIEKFVRIIESLHDLELHVSEWKEWEQGSISKQPPLGLILSMEGSDPIVGPWQVEAWWKNGLRIASLVHYGYGPYGSGHDREGGLTPAGLNLLPEFEKFKIILDVTHLNEQGFREALDSFGGRVLASHSNCRALVPGNRQLSDDQIRQLIQRKAVIGIALDNWMLYPGWPGSLVFPESKQVVSLEDLVNHIDHICQMAGSAHCVSIGSDLDGGYGAEQTPKEVDTIADLLRIPDILAKRGYERVDIENIMYGNWIHLLKQAWS